MHSMHLAIDKGDVCVIFIFISFGRTSMFETPPSCKVEPEVDRVVCRICACPLAILK